MNLSAPIETVQLVHSRFPLASEGLLRCVLEVIWGSFFIVDFDAIVNLYRGSYMSGHLI